MPLTTNYEHSETIDQYSFETVVDWLAAGVNPGAATVFVQSKVPEHAELHLMLSMIAPLAWLERVPSYKDQQQKLHDRDLATYGFLGYPLLQAADILIYRAGRVPVGADQVAHVELTREIARRFNHVYGREPGFEELAEAAVKKMGKKAARLYVDLRREYQERGDAEALEQARALLAEQQNLSIGDTERLFGYLKGSGRIILPEPQSMLTEQSKMRVWTARKCQSLTTTPLVCVKIRNLWKVRYAPCRQTQPECGVTIRVTQTFARCLRCTKCITPTMCGSGRPGMQVCGYWLC